MRYPWSMLGFGCFSATVAVLSVSPLAAQRPSPISITRVYTGTNGETHTERMDIPVTPRPAPFQLAEISELFGATGLRLRRWTPGYVSDFNPATDRSYMIGISGHAVIETSDGTEIVMEPGRILLMDDVTGEGHKIRAAGPEDCITASVSAPAK
jgi:hypothetical protein